MKQLLIFSAFILLCITGFAQTKPTTDQFLARLDSISKAMVGKPYPDFEYKDDDGIVYSKQKMLGKKYYINFWFEGCHPCMDEMPELVELKKKIDGKNIGFISFTWDAPAARKRVKELMKINFPVIPVTNEVCHRLNFNKGFPTHIIVDEKGNVAYVSTMTGTHEQEMKDIFSLLMK